MISFCVVGFSTYVFFTCVRKNGRKNSTHLFCWCLLGGCVWAMTLLATALHTTAALVSAANMTCTDSINIEFRGLPNQHGTILRVPWRYDFKLSDADQKTTPWVTYRVNTTTIEQDVCTCKFVSEGLLCLECSQQILQTLQFHQLAPHPTLLACPLCYRLQTYTYM